MKIGIFTYGTRGDVQPYIALALGLIDRGHEVTIAAPENFKNLAAGFGIGFHPLVGDAEREMNSTAGQKVVQTGNTIKLLKFFYEALHTIRHPLRQSYLDAAAKVDFIVANLATLPIISAIAEKQNKKMALTYFMPPPVPTNEFAMAGLDFINLKGYNKFSYKLARIFYWKFVKEDTNEFRKELGLTPLFENLADYIDRAKPLDLYCFSPSLIPRPADWEPHHQVTGFLTVPAKKRENHSDDHLPAGLSEWLGQGPKPIYIGFGSNGVGDHINIGAILQELLDQTGERILFCTGWALYRNLPEHSRLFIAKYVNHEVVLPLCKLGLFHGGAGTLAAMLRNNLPVIIVSFYTDQPAWGKIIERKHLGVHLPAKRLTAKKLLAAIALVQTDSIRENLTNLRERLLQENGVEMAVSAIEGYFGFQ